MRLPARHRRRRIAIVAILCLLFQQVALAAYACPLPRMPPPMATMAAMTEHCAGMGMQQAEDNPALCDKHCAPDVSTPADPAKLSVPALALPPMAFAPMPATPSTRIAAQADIPIERSDPPLRLRFCSFLI